MSAKPNARPPAPFPVTTQGGKPLQKGQRYVPVVRGKCSVPTCFARQVRADETTLCSGHLQDEQTHANNRWQPNDWTVCKADQCDKESYRWGYCPSHYKRALRVEFLRSIETSNSGDNRKRRRRIPLDYVAVPGSPNYKKPVPDSLLDAGQRQQKAAARYNELPDQ